MAEFVRAQIFGTTFEITSRYRLAGSGASARAGTEDADFGLDTPIYSRWAWARSALSGE